MDTICDSCKEKLKKLDASTFPNHLTQCRHPSEEDDIPKSFERRERPSLEEKERYKITIDLDTIYNIVVYLIFIAFIVICICAFFGSEGCLKFLKSLQKCEHCCKV